MMQATISVFAMLIILTHGQGPRIYSYPESKENGWEEAGSMCKDGQNQSPINIVPSEAHVDTSLPPLNTSAMQHTIRQAMIMHKKHGIAFIIPPDNRENKLRGATLPDRDYILAQLHFHTSVNGPGSEHELNGQKMAAELHIMFYDGSTYENIMDAINPNARERGFDVLVVLTILFRESESDGELIEPLVQLIKAYPDQSAKDFKRETISDLPLKPLIESTTQGFYGYTGAITIPNCEEVCTYIIGRGVVPISRRQLDYIRHKQNINGNLPFNNKMVKPLNSRRVVTNTPTKGGGALAENPSGEPVVEPTAEPAATPTAAAIVGKAVGDMPSEASGAEGNTAMALMASIVVSLLAV